MPLASPSGARRARPRRQLVAIMSRSATVAWPAWRKLYCYFSAVR